MKEGRGADGVVPFSFQCQRSGRCCTGGSGVVWVEEEEVPALAEALGSSVEAFTRRFLRRVLDPRRGEERLSLRERSGAGDSGAACDLLEGSNHCRVYTARPRHCREFPFWPSVLEDEAAFEAARATCPGIEPLVPEEVKRQAFEALEALYAELDEEVRAQQPRCELSGLCCRFEEAGHRLYATPLEADYAAHLHPSAPAPEAEGRCPYHVGGRCTARAGRALGCRTYYCDERTSASLEAMHERYLGRIRELERRLGYPAGYAPFPALLERRGVGAEAAR